MINSIESEIKVREASIEDWDLIWGLLYKMGKTDSEQGVKSRYYKMIDSTEQYIPVATYRNKIVGYAWAQDYGYHLRSGKNEQKTKGENDEKSH